MPFVTSSYLRALEIEGRHPQDAGNWGITIQRLEFGEGLHPNTLEYNVHYEEDAALPPALKLSPNSRLPRPSFYKRVRSSAECECISRTKNTGILIGLYLFRGWVNPEKNIIPIPEQGEEPLANTHSVALVDCKNTRRQFRIWNNWKNWGDNGYAFLPYTYFDEYVFESWMTYRNVVFESKRKSVLSNQKIVRWVARDEMRHRIYGYEVWDKDEIDRLGWTFVVERDNALEIEEFYVRPECRRNGYGRLLADFVKELATAKKRFLHMWVPFADCKTESPGNFSSLIGIAHYLGLGFQHSPVRWAAYLATNETPGNEEPIEPDKVPARPRNSWKEMLVSLSSMNGVNRSVNGDEITSAIKMWENFPAVNSPKWVEMNDRRAELIRKDIYQGLTISERTEYEYLQKMSLETYLKAYPPPKLDTEALLKLGDELRASASRRKE